MIFSIRKGPKPKQGVAQRATQLGLEHLEPRCLLSDVAGGETHAVATLGLSSTLFTLTPAHALYRHIDATGWTLLGQNIVSASASAEASGNVVVFALTADHALACYDNISGWQMIGASGTIASISSGADQNGRADVFVTTTDGTFTEYRGSSGWLASPLEAPGTVLAWDALNNDAVVAVTTSNQIMEHNDQFGWFPLSGPGFAKSVSAVTDATGRLTVFATTTSDGLDQLVSGGAWTPIGGAGTIAGVSAGSDTSGQAMSAVLTTAGDLLEFDTSGGWLFVHPPGPVARMNAIALDRIYFVLDDGSVFGHDDQFGSYRMTSIGFAATQ